MTLKGKVPLHNTEDPEKIRSSILNIFPSAEIELKDEDIRFTVEDNSNFLEILDDLQIRDTVVSILDRSLDGDRTEFFLNKQAAFVGKVNFTDGNSTLGDIRVIVDGGAVDLIEKIRPEPF